MSKFIGYIGKTKNISTVSELLAKNNNLECVYRNDKEFLISKDINDVSNFKSSTTIISTGDIIKNDVFTICGTVTIDNYDGDKNKNGLTFILDKLTTLYLQDKDVISALDKIKNYIDGSYAIIILLNTDVSLLYATKYNYPLYITFGPCENFLSFDITNIIKLHENYIKLSNDEIAVLKENNMLIYKNKEIVNKPIKKLKWTKEVALKNGYEHYMLKEIWETPTVINNSIDYLMKEIVDLSKYKEIDIVACGSAYNSGLIGSYLIEKYSNIKVRVETSSEYRYKKGILSNEKLVIVISQSGETTDSLASLKLAKKCKNDTLAITNVAGSSIAKESNNIIYSKAGCEIAISSTKTFSLQLLILSIIAYKIGRNNNSIDDIEDRIITKEYHLLKNKIIRVLDKDIDDVANTISQYNDVFCIGRSIDYAIALEGALKLKEVSYIHTSTYQAGELKHSAMTLMTNKSLVIGIITNEDLADKTMKNIKEIKERGTYIVLIITKRLIKLYDNNYYDNLIVIDDTHPLLTPIMAIVALQLIAYKVGILKGCEVDKPRNRVKTVLDI